MEPESSNAPAPLRMDNVRVFMSITPFAGPHPGRPRTFSHQSNTLGLKKLRGQMLSTWSGVLPARQCRQLLPNSGGSMKPIRETLLHYHGHMLGFVIALISVSEKPKHFHPCVFASIRGPKPNCESLSNSKENRRFGHGWTRIHTDDGDCPAFFALDGHYMVMFLAKRYTSLVGR